MDKKIEGYIFDLDGVITDTARYHYLAWKKIADELNIVFTEKTNERLKGVSREKSFDIILEEGQKKEMPAEERARWCKKKNDIYISYIENMKKEEVLPGVREFLNEIRNGGKKTALGSASKNARQILDRLGLIQSFDVIVDGNMVKNAKPDPEVFLKAAALLHIEPENCVVFEDSIAGIIAARCGGMKTVGIGDKAILKEADVVITEFTKWMPEQIENNLIN